MQPTDDTKSPRDELFRRIGRNVVHFQYLEATLRSMIPSLSKKWTLKEPQGRQDDIPRKHKKSTLGELTDAYHERVFGKNLADEAMTDEGLSEPTLDVGVHIEVTPETEAQRKRALVNLVIERNRLIHRDLLNIDLKSREQCEELSARLDEQYTRIRNHLEYLNSLRTRIGEMAAEFQRFLESDEFLAFLKGEGDDA